MRPAAGRALTLAAPLAVVGLVVGLVAPASSSASPALASSPPASSPSGDAPATVPPAGRAVLVPTALAGSTAPVPTASGLQQQLGDLLADPALGSAAVAVLDPATGSTLFDVDGGRASTPASTTKVLTGVAVLTALGPDAHLRTRVVAGAAKGDLVLVGAGDSTLTRDPQPADPEQAAAAGASLSALAVATAKSLADAGIDRVRLRVDDTLFQGPTTAPSWPNSYVAGGVVAPVTALMVDHARLDGGGRSSDPPLSAGRAFAEELEALGVEVRGEVARAAAAPGAAEVAGVDSPPLADLVEQMTTASDNDLAEALAHLAGGALGGEASFAGGARATVAALQALGLTTDGLHLDDGSGLSREDAIPPVVLASTLAAVATGATAAQPAAGAAAPAQPVWAVGSGLPVAGLTGTLADRFAAPSVAGALGLVRAKTGTLSGVLGLAGTVRDADGRVLAYAVLARDVPDPFSGEAVLDRIAATLAACGCR